jgi:hypothetical protein
MKILILTVFLSLVSSLAFSQKVDYAVPSEYKGSISVSDYKRMVDKSIAILTTNNYKIEKVKDGIIILQNGQALQDISMEILIIKCEEVSNVEACEKEIEKHFKFMFSTVEGR